MLRRATTLLASGRVRAIVAAGLIAVTSRVGHAQPTSLRVSGSPAAMRIQGSTAGQTPVPVVESSTTYTSAFPQTAKITAQLNAAMPAGTTLSITLTGTGNSIPTPDVVLDVLARDVITNIKKGNNSGSISYTFSASLSAGVVPLQTRTVTLTVVSAP